MDFSKLSKVSFVSKPINPIEIFEKLPNLPGTPNDLWRGQTEALTQWHEKRLKKDIYIGLNTGAGKTLAGLLIAQSLVNEGVENILYVCATIDLVNQTAREADKIGINYSLRTEGKYNIDLFESGKAFCITTYHALFNGLSSIRKNYFPAAIILDDAHVAEQMLRDAMTITISSHAHHGLYRELVSLFKSHFHELDKTQDFADVVRGDHPGILMTTSTAIKKNKNQILGLFDKYKISEDSDLKYSYPHLKDHIDRCAILFGRGKIEITPPFLPSLALDIFERPIRRIYLSATLKYKTDLIRAFGRMPEVIIEPKNDAGNGERLILFSKYLKGGLTLENVKNISSNNKTLIAVKSYREAKTWEALAVPPKANAFSYELDAFRKSKAGVFILVSRVDGIDLPHDTCRVMVIDGLPSSGSLLEQYQWEFLSMRNLHAVRMANRIVQLFGRINRGRNDYGVFIVRGNALNNWLSNDRNLTLLPQLLEQQVHLGKIVQEGLNIKNEGTLTNTISSVLGREQTWLEYYADNVSKGTADPDKVARAELIESKLVRAAEAEAKYASYTWDSDHKAAIKALEDTVEDTSRADTLLAGWHNVWLGVSYEAENDFESASQSYNRARVRLGRNYIKPKISAANNSDKAIYTRFAKSLFEIISIPSQDSFKREFDLLDRGMLYLESGTPNQMEEAVRFLGETLGFESSRPDNDNQIGPDVLWVDSEKGCYLGFELKTDKIPSSQYTKEEIGQGYNHLQWMKTELSTFSSLGLLYVGPYLKCTASANPSTEMGQVEPQILRQLGNELLALIHDLRSEVPNARPTKVQSISNDANWHLSNLLKRFESKAISKE